MEKIIQLILEVCFDLLAEALIFRLFVVLNSFAVLLSNEGFPRNFCFLVSIIGGEWYNLILLSHFIDPIFSFDLVKISNPFSRFLRDKLFSKRNRAIKPEHS